MTSGDFSFFIDVLRKDFCFNGDGYELLFLFFFLIITEFYTSGKWFSSNSETLLLAPIFLDLVSSNCGKKTGEFCFVRVFFGDSEGEHMENYAT